MTNNFVNIFSMVVGLVFLAACSTQAKKNAPEVDMPVPHSKTVVGRDHVSGQVVGFLSQSSRFAKLEIGMTRTDVEKIVGRPNDLTAQSIGTAWVPYYFGSDTWHTESYYRGEGRLVFDTNSRLVLIDVTRK